MAPLTWGLIVLFGSLTVLLAPPAGADWVARWTTTEDFEAGTRAQASPAGNYEVETCNDNPRVSCGDLWPLTVLGDHFALADADADTWRWDRAPGTGCDGGTADINTNVGSRFYVVNGVGSVDQGIIASGPIQGASLDLHLLLDESTSDGAGPDINANASVALLSEKRCVQDVNCGDCGTTFDGVQYIWSEGAAVDATFTLTAYTIANGAWTICGAATSVTNADPVALRIVKSTNSWTFYYSDADAADFAIDAAAWTEDETCTQAAGNGPLYTYMGSHGAVGVNAPFEFDHYHVVIGEPDEGVVDTDCFGTDGGLTCQGVIESGADWTSPAFNTGEETLVQLTLTGTGSTAAYVELIDLLSRTIVVQSYSGQRKTMTGIMALGTLGWVGPINVRFAFASDGESYATIEEIVLRSESPGSGKPPPKPDEMDPTFPCRYRWWSRAFVCTNLWNPAVVPGTASVAWTLTSGRTVVSTGVGNETMLGTGAPPWDVGIDRYGLMVIVTLGNGVTHTFTRVPVDDDRPWLLVYLFLALSVLALLVWWRKIR